jgi:hypothetical protein
VSALDGDDLRRPALDAQGRRRRCVRSGRRNIGSSADAAGVRAASPNVASLSLRAAPGRAGST